MTEREMGEKETKRAENVFRREDQAKAATGNTADYNADKAATLKRTARLRGERLAREAVMEASAKPPPKAKKKKPE